MRNTMALSLGLVPIGLGHGLLELDGSAQRIDGARKLDQGTIAGELDQAAAMAGQHRFQAQFAVLAAGAPSVPLSSRPIRRE